MRRIVIVLALALAAVAQVWGAEKEKGQFELFLNGVNKGYDRYKIEQNNKKGLWTISSEIHFKLPMPKAKRGYVDLMIYPVLDMNAASRAFEGYYYRMNFNDFSKTDLVEADQSATEIIDQDFRNYDLFNRSNQLQQDEQADRIDLGVNAGKVVPAGDTLHFSETKFSDTRIKDEPLPANFWIVDAYTFSPYIPLAQHALNMKGDSEPITIVFPQAMRLSKEGRLEYMGAEKTPFRGKIMILKHYDVLAQGTIISSFWVDKAGKLVLVAVPSQGLVAAIAKYKPEPFDREEPRLAKETLVVSGSFTEKPVRLSSGPVTLGGTLTLPNGQGPFPTVLMVQDLVPLDRDGNDPTNPYSRASTWKQLAFGLAESGFASLRTDSRGVGESSGDIEKTLFSERVSDVEAEARWLTAQPTTKGGKVILLSLGLGGWPCAVAADQVPVSGVVAFAYPAKELMRLWKEQVNTIQDPQGLLKASQELDKLQNSLETSGSEWSTLSDRKIYLPAARTMLSVDPLALASAVKVPCLFAYPERDQTVMAFHKDVLAPALHQGQQAMVIPGLGHRLTPVDEENNPSGLVDTKALAPVMAWMAKVAAPSGAP